jgi:hypothetical protein
LEEQVRQLGAPPVGDGSHYLGEPGWSRLLQARAQRRGRPGPANDTWIAACCLVRRHPLATLNLKDFADFAHYDGLPIIGYETAT